MYNYELLPYTDLSDEIIDGKRFYLTPEGEKLKSVTTILGEKLPKDALENWRNRIGEEKADAISNFAKVRGTRLHKIAEDYLHGKNYLMGAMPPDIMMFKQIKPYLEENLTDIYGIELPLYSYNYKTAGRTDLVGKFDGINSIIDFKTSRNVKKEEWILHYFLQKTCYGLMVEEKYGIEIPQIVTLIAVDGAFTGQIFINEKAKFVDQVKEIFEYGKQ